MKNRTANPIRAAEAWLRERNIEYKRPSGYQLKVGDVNYYPGTGVIFVDTETERRSKTGLDALAEVLRQRAQLCSPTRPPAPLREGSKPGREFTQAPIDLAIPFGNDGHQDPK